MRKNKDNEDRLEGLQLPQNLETLNIFYHRGNRISRLRIMLLSKLQSMALDWCMNLVQLPPLGELAALESLITRRMKNL